MSKQVPRRLIHANPVNRTLLATAFTLALGILVCETILLRKAADQLRLTEIYTSQLRAEIDRLKTLIAEARFIASEPSSSTVPAPPADTSSDAIIRTLHGRVRSLQRMFELVPEEQIPELRFLTKNDWISAVIERELATAEEFATALSYARNKARRNFARLLKSALKKYLAASNDILPETPLALLPYFDPLVDASILSRHEMILSGSTAGLEPRTAVMREKSSSADGPSDHLAETGLTFTNFVNASKHGQHRIKPEVVTALAEATMAFRRDHRGKEADTFNQLRPYLKNLPEIDRVARELVPPSPR